jgi:hypothetical protein
MDCENVLIWNVRGLNSRARRVLVADYVSQECVSVVYLQERGDQVVYFLW